MPLSSLQRSILLASLDGRELRVPRKRLQKYYEKAHNAPSPKDQQDAVTKSLERMIKKGFLIGYGRRTPEKLV